MLTCEARAPGGEVEALALQCATEAAAKLWGGAALTPFPTEIEAARIALARQWRPIGTAPQDETFIDVCDRHGNRTTDVKWNTGRKRWEVWAGSWEADWTELSPPPVYWMPIPATPKEPA